MQHATGPVETWERHAGAACAPLGEYRRREPEKTLLHEVVRDRLESFLAAARERSASGRGLPAFVERHFRAYLDCGILARGFARVRCPDCGFERLVAFSCKAHLCPSCNARRMEDTADHLVRNVLPAVPVRQWVLSMPRRVRFMSARHPALATRLLDLFTRAVFAWQRRSARRLGVADPRTAWKPRSWARSSARRTPRSARPCPLAARGESASSLARLTDVREVADDHDRRRAIAADFARLPEEERARTIVVAGANEARRGINRAVREDLGLAGRGHEYATLVRRDTTQAERTFSKNYAPGDVIQPERDYPRAGLARGALYEVIENGPGNRITVRGEQGEVVTFSPMACRRLSVYEAERSELAGGDRVRITRNDAALDLANGDRFTVAAVTPAAVTLTDGRRRVELPANHPLHLDHAYATTVHASQGTTAERVLIDASTRSWTTSQDVYYVAISRARQEARVYTDDLTRLPAAIARERAKHAALDLERG